MAGASAQRLAGLPLYCNCSIDGCGLDNHDSKYICATNGGCRKTVTIENGQLNTRYSCIPEELYQPIERPVACNVHRRNQHVQNVGCCRDRSFCAQNLDVQLLQRYSSDSSGSGTGGQGSDGYLNGWHVALFAIIFIIISIVLGLVYFCVRKRIFRKSALNKSQSEFRPFLRSNCGGSATCASGDVNNMLIDIERMFDEENATGSDSGKGPALLVPRTVAHSVELKEVIGKGRFGEVLRGVWRSEDVAVKLFSSRDEQSWLREVEIYETHLTHHENILRYIAADNKDSGISMKLFLITEYHPNGSLYDYLNRTTVDDTGLCVMVQSMASGLAFLHSEITGTRNKPAIAHRDIKSKNILVNNDGSCCVADLGLAVRYDAPSGTIDIPNNNKVGTKRYLAPEVLDNTMGINQFDNYRRADMYSVGLVIWEICRRTKLNGLESPYELPYYDMVQPDPSMEEMQNCVCDEKKRPTVLEEWQMDPLLREMVRIMRECWASKPDARLTALRVKKSVNALLSSTSRGMSIRI